MKLSLGSLIWAASAAFVLISHPVAGFAQEGNVVIYRPYDAGNLLKPSVYVDGKQTARLPVGCYISMRLAAGKHSFESSMKKAVLETEVRPNATIYLQMVLQAGIMHGVGRLVLVNPDDAKAFLPNLRPLDANQTLPETATASSPPPPTPQPAAAPSPAAPSDTPPAEAESSAPAQPASVIVKSTPPGADITVDGKFMGNTPSTIALDAGEHLVLIEKEGLRPWQRTMTVSPGGSLTIDATLTKP